MSDGGEPQRDQWREPDLPGRRAARYPDAAQIVGGVYGPAELCGQRGATIRSRLRPRLAPMSPRCGVQRDQSQWNLEPLLFVMIDGRRGQHLRRLVSQPSPPRPLHPRRRRLRATTPRPADQHRDRDQHAAADLDSISGAICNNTHDAVPSPTAARPASIRRTSPSGAWVAV